MSVHICTLPSGWKHTDLPEDMSDSLWVNHALQWYSRWYRFHDYEEGELDELLKTRTDLLKRCPKKYQLGVHLIGAGAAHCGEDIFVVDGKLQHVLWKVCSECDGCSILVRQNQHWCANCNKYVTSKFIGEK